jgi:hypothetical protein
MPGGVVYIGTTIILGVWDVEFCGAAAAAGGATTVGPIMVGELVGEVVGAVFGAFVVTGAVVVLGDGDTIDGVLAVFGAVVGAEAIVGAVVGAVVGAEAMVGAVVGKAAITGEVPPPDAGGFEAGCITIG